MVGKHIFLIFSFLVKFGVYNLQLFCGCLQKQSNHKCFQWNWQHLDPHSAQNSVEQCPHHLFPKSVQWNIFNQFSHGTNMKNSRHLHELLTFPTTLEKSYFLKASSQRWACSSVGITYRIPLWGTHPAVLIISLILFTPRRETCLVMQFDLLAYHSILSSLENSQIWTKNMLYRQILAKNALVLDVFRFNTQFWKKIRRRIRCFSI